MGNKAKSFGIIGNPEDVAELSAAMKLVLGDRIKPLIIRPQPSPDGNDEGLTGVNGSGQKLDQESFLHENERHLKASSFGFGITDPNHPTNDA